MMLPILLLALLGGSMRTDGIDSVLRRDGDRYGTFGPTGGRLFTERIEPGLGLHGQFCYIHHSDIRDPVTLEWEAPPDAEPPKLVQTTWYPSHLEAEWELGGRRVVERKFITEDDVLVDVIDLVKGEGRAPGGTFEVKSGIAKEEFRPGSRFSEIDLRSVVNANPSPAENLFSGKEGPFRLWREGEAYTRQEGSTGKDEKPAASGAEVLGRDFGGAVGHWVEYEFETPALSGLTISLRAARLADKPAHWKVSIDGKQRGELHVPATGGWGERDEDFAWCAAWTGALEAGRHVLRFESTEWGSNTNFDGFLLAEFSLGFRAVRLHDGSMKWLEKERVLYEPGQTHVGAVPYDLIDPAQNGGKGIIVLNGGDAADAASRYPQSVTIPVQGAEGANRLYMLGQVGGFIGSERGPHVIYRLHFDSGEPAEFQVPPMGEMRRWTDDLRPFSAPLPPRRTLTSIEVVDGGSRVAPVVAAATLELHAPGELPPTRLLGRGEFYGVSATFVAGAAFRIRATGGPSIGGLRVRMGGSQAQRIVLACAVAEGLEEANRRADFWLNADDPLREHERQYQKWFDETCPIFDCDDPYMTKLWTYRWFIARHCLSLARTGNLKYPCFFEGMHGGWFPSEIAYSSPHIIDEVRWLRDPQYAFGQGRDHAAVAGEHGVFESLRINWIGSWYTNWIPMSMWRAYLVHSQKPYLQEVIGAMAADVKGLFKRFDKDGDKLCTPPSHWPTGMEWQPAFFYFNDYDNTKPEAPLERGDLVGYHYGNARAVASAYELVLKDEKKAREFNDIADGIRDACLRKMWNEKDHWFYAVREGDDVPAPCMEVVGFYPFMTHLPPDSGTYAEALQYLGDDAYFWNPFPVTTVSKKCPVYTPTQQKWPGPGGTVTGCMWNGPTWPHANSIIANVLANVLRDYRTNTAVTPELYWRFLHRFTHLHFEDDNLAHPMIREYYDGETGKGWGCYDYFHSTYNDLIISHVAGLVPSADDTITLKPIPGPLKHFRVDRLRYHGHELVITWNGDGHYSNAPDGFSLLVDGVVAAERKDLGALSCSPGK
jgi:hypothetical protein